MKYTCISAAKHGIKLYYFKLLYGYSVHCVLDMLQLILVDDVVRVKLVPSHHLQMGIQSHVTLLYLLKIREAG